MGLLLRERWWMMERDQCPGLQGWWGHVHQYDEPHGSGQDSGWGHSSQHPIVNEWKSSSSHIANISYKICKKSQEYRNTSKKHTIIVLCVHVCTFVYICCYWTFYLDKEWITKSQSTLKVLTEGIVQETAARQQIYQEKMAGTAHTPHVYKYIILNGRLLVAVLC